METYTIQIHYRYGNDEKCFYEKDFTAESEEKAHQLARADRRNIFNTYTVTKKPIEI